MSTDLNRIGITSTGDPAIDASLLVTLVELHLITRLEARVALGLTSRENVRIPVRPDPVEGYLPHDHECPPISPEFVRRLRKIRDRLNSVAAWPRAVGATSASNQRLEVSHNAKREIAAVYLRQINDLLYDAGV